MDEVRLLIVDDSRIFRGFLEQALAGIAGVRIVGSVFSGDKALEFLAANEADLITLDVAMPGRDGLATLLAIREQASCTGRLPAVVMVSAHTTAGAPATIEALAQGAFDFITKPSGADAQANAVHLRDDLIRVIHAWKSSHGRGTVVSSRPPTRPSPASLPTATAPRAPMAPLLGGPELVAIGCSTGGPKALRDMLPDLCQVTDLPILIVQHMPPNFTASLAENLSHHCSHAVVEGAEGMEVTARRVCIAPGGSHMILRREGTRMIIGLNQQPPERGCRPSVDVLFRSVATTLSNRVVAIVLTGMGDDGTNGLKALKRAGAFSIVQDKASSVVWGMPGAAVAAGVADRVEDLRRIPTVVAEILEARCRT